MAWDNGAVLIEFIAFLAQGPETNRRPFAHMAATELVGCSLCLDRGYCRAANEVDRVEAGELRRWRKSSPTTCSTRSSCLSQWSPRQLSSSQRDRRRSGHVIPDPVWPTLVLAAVQLADAVFCAIPTGFVTRCLDDVGLPLRFRPFLPALKFGAAAGLVAGLWIDYLGAVTAAGLILYFILAVAAHIRVRDIGRNMLNASVILAFSAFVFVTFL